MHRSTSTTSSRSRAPRRPLVPALTLGVLATCLTGVAGAPAAHAGGGLGVSSDFNGDGYEDLAIGSPYQAVRNKPNAGTVTVSYGGFGGVSAGGTQLWHADSPGLDGDATAMEFFGTAVAAADFDGDGYADLAVGVPGNDVGATGAGSVVVLKGGPGGLTSTGSREYRQGAGVPGTADSGEGFGWALAAGDFDRDGRADLAVGAIGDTTGGIRGGTVSVLRGVDEWNGAPPSWNRTPSGPTARSGRVSRPTVRSSGVRSRPVTSPGTVSTTSSWVPPEPADHPPARRRGRDHRAERPHRHPR